MPTNQQKPVRRTDVVHCDNCGEDYSVTYKRCPFCDERPGVGGRSPGGLGKRVATNTRGGGYGRGVNPLQVAGLVISLVLIIAALYIVFTVIAPLFGKGGTKPNSSSSTSQSSSAVQPGGSGSGAAVLPEPQPVDPEPVAPVVSALTLDRKDVTLKADQAFTLKATVAPASAAEYIKWSSDNESAATVSENGTVTNVNAGTSTVAVKITAQIGETSVSCIVRCHGGSTGTAPSGGGSITLTPGGTTGDAKPGSAGIVVNAGSGLNVRSGPGTSYAPVASIVNGNTVRILEDAGDGWYKISFDVGGGKTETGYVSKDFISAS